jgi:hypothetical protein
MLSKEQKDRMRDEINREITKCYPKLELDFLQITGAGFKKFDELLSYTLEYFLTKKTLEYQYQVVIIDGKFLNWMGRAMSLFLKSSTSPYYTHIRKPVVDHLPEYLAINDRSSSDNSDYIPEIGDPRELDPMSCMLWALEQLDFYHRQLVTDYYLNGLKFGEIKEKYGININHVSRDVKYGLKLIRRKCKHFIK